MDKILIATVRRKCKLLDDSGWTSRLFTSFDRFKLKDAIEEHYKILLKKVKADDFPYFTDGGFKYTVETENWTYCIEAHSHEIIK